PQCSMCDSSLGRLLSCLHCDFVGCWKRNHLRRHQSTSKHTLAVEFNTHSVFCMTCGDFVYYHNFEEILRQEKFKISTVGSEGSDHDSSLASTPTAGPSPVSPCEGIRGLRNMGSTCFMNVILQAFIHNPLLRAHFLSDPHNAHQCSRDACIACEMDSLFNQIFSGDPAPFGPSTFLRSIWQSSTELAGYSQQDAHEFFITALNQIHSGLSQNEHTLGCYCVVHQTFAGLLQSTVTCRSCGHVATAHDPMLDISLDIRPLPRRPKKGGANGGTAPSHNPPNNNNSNSNNNNNNIAKFEIPHSLVDCLQRFTSPESLGSQEYHCGSCGSACREASKQMLIKLLPPVLSFQLKRFEHNASASKIETFIRIPSELDMTPFTTQHVRPADGTDTSSLPYSNPACHYQLFAVINHEGSLETGHYTMYAMHRKEWFRFDDHLVTVASLSDVLKNNAYMCFYVKSYLDYIPT
ncbi:hypothetical protein BJ085DRAFT_15791, partial [Dimargaris cristalligena]